MDWVRVVDLGKIAQAYELAERHRDFRSLVELSNDAKHGSATKTKYFMEKHSEDFAFALYNFLLEKGSYFSRYHVMNGLTTDPTSRF